MVARLKGEGKRLVFTNGCFDLLHVGHVRSLAEAKGLGDVLIVGLNSDGSVRRLKGEGHPLVPQEERAEVLAALEAVDYVVIFEEDTAERLLSLLQPHIYAKGGNYTLETLPEAPAVLRYGGEVRILSLTPGVSTSNLIDRLRTQLKKGG
jgi:rfaE bifunctional protein nucleotidyltransferase chain/domain